MTDNNDNTAILHSKRAVYVGGLAENVGETTLRAAMIPFGPIKSIELPMDYVKGVHRGFGIVEYDDPDDAMEAIDNMNGAEIMGRTLSVSVAQPNQFKNHFGGSNNTSKSKAVWSNDEWFQNNMQQHNSQQQEQQERQQQDESELATPVLMKPK